MIIPSIRKGRIKGLIFGFGVRTYLFVISNGLLAQIRGLEEVLVLDEDNQFYREEESIQRTKLYQNLKE